MLIGEIYEMVFIIIKFLGLIYVIGDRTYWLWSIDIHFILKELKQMGVSIIFCSKPFILWRVFLLPTPLEACAEKLLPYILNLSDSHKDSKISIYRFLLNVIQ